MRSKSHAKVRTKSLMAPVSESNFDKSAMSLSVIGKSERGKDSDRPNIDKDELNLKLTKIKTVIQPKKTKIMEDRKPRSVFSNKHISKKDIFEVTDDKVNENPKTSNKDNTLKEASIPDI